MKTAQSTFLPPNVVASCLSLALWSVLTLAHTGSAQSYTLSDLGSNSWSYSEAHGLSGTGRVVGEYEPLSFFYVLAFEDIDGTLTDLGHLNGAPYAVAYGINDGNQVVGESDTANSTHAFLYSNGSMTDLGTLSANNLAGYSSAHAINKSGQIVGESTVSASQSGTIHAVLFSGNSKSDLGALGGDYSSANALNNTGMIVGESDVVEQGITNVHAFEYSGGKMIDLGTLGGAYSSAKGVNDSGVVVGETETTLAGTTYLHAFVYQNGKMNDLGTLGGASSSASAINAAGQIVGYATDTNEVANAFLYDGAKMINLNDFLPAGSGFTNLSSADAINDAGQIAGSGYLADGSYHAYLLTPTGPLTVIITNPPPNSTFQAPASFWVGAAVVDTAGSVTNVEFLANNQVLGNAKSAPYLLSVSNLTQGTYRLGALAFDSLGNSASNFISITVSAPVGIPPTVTITNPAPNSTFLAPASFQIGASASDSDGSVTNVEFLVNGVHLTDVVTVPYLASLSNLAAGTYQLTAIATDNTALTATNSIQIDVLAVTNFPPSVIITNPAPNSTFQAPATITIGATASDTDGTVTNVQFLVNGMIIANAHIVPYGATTASLAAGTYSLTAIATDNMGATATNTVPVIVGSGQIASVTLMQPGLTGQNFNFSFQTQTGVVYQGQSASALGPGSGWTTFTNVTGNGALVQFMAPALPTGTHFYRVVAQ